MPYPHAHDQAGNSEERLDDSLDESSDTVDVSSSENSASFNIDSEEENLANQKTCKTKCCHDYEDLTDSKEKQR